MDPHQNGEPPAKKRRFLTDPEDDVAFSDASSPAAVPHASSSKPRFFQEVEGDDEVPPLSSHHADTSRSSMNPLEDTEMADIPSSPGAEAGPSNQGSASLAFDKETFEAFIGNKIKPDVLAIIRDHCGDDIERAVNMYFDGTWKNLKKKGKTATTQARMAFASKPAEPRPPESRQDSSRLLQSMPESRYIGAFGVEGWATRSGTNLLKHGDVVKIERQKILPPKKASAAVMKRVDVIVRFTDGKGMEVGRLAKDTANWVSALIDQKVCKFQGTCVYAPERLRTNDTVFLQLRCSLLRSAFRRQGLRLSDNRTTGVFEEKETTEERDLRLRQVAMVRLFQEINLNPSKLNAAAARHQRQGLLEAADLAEKREGSTKSKEKGDASGASTPSEDEDGEELQQDQLDALYKKAQSFDFSTPEAEPAHTFAMTLRPYQKQALHWMTSKEKNEKEKRHEVSMHPLWEEYIWPVTDFDDKDVPRVADQPCFYMNPYSGDLSLEFPAQEQHCLGGILADEMGLGKTIQMLSLIHTHRSEVAEDATNSSNSLATVNDLPRLPSAAGVVSAPRTTLVVAPMSLLAQWQSGEYLFPLKRSPISLLKYAFLTPTRS